MARSQTKNKVKPTCSLESCQRTFKFTIHFNKCHKSHKPSSHSLTFRKFLYKIPELMIIEALIQPMSHETNFADEIAVEAWSRIVVTIVGVRLQVDRTPDEKSAPFAQVDIDNWR